MARGSITNEQVDFVETWENVSPTTNYVITLDVRGEEKHVPISQPKQFTLTTQERMITQGKILDPRHDPFRNGCFRPVITPDDISIETNPNALSDEDIRRIFGASRVAWDEWLSTVDSENTLRRMLTIADDAPDDIPLSRYRELEARVRDVTGGPRHANQKDEKAFAALGGDGGDKETRKNASKRAMTSTSSSK